MQKMKKFNLDDWLEIHNMDKIEMLLKQCVYAIQQAYPQRSMTLVGYCTGGKQGLRLASSSAIKAAALFHPVCPFARRKENDPALPINC
jgi:dienelactone hydrolase